MFWKTPLKNTTRVSVLKEKSDVKKELHEMTLEELWELFPIILEEHHDQWTKWYQEEQDHLLSLLSNVNLVRIAHVGSTAINGIWAKPIIDILIETQNKEDFEAVYHALLDGGYICMYKNERIGFNKGYTKDGFAKRVFHIHVHLNGDHDELYFRDYMNENSLLAKKYEDLKLELWKQYEHDRDGYTNAKTDFIKTYTEQAKKEYASRYE